MMNQGGSSYLSDLTEHQWEIIKDMIPVARPGGRRRTTCMRSVLNAIFYVNRTGMAWRYLPPNFPPWKTVYDYFNQWRRMNAWKNINDCLVREVRLASGRKEYPSCLIIDSQTAKAHYGGQRGWDGFKKMQGRKRQILVDTLGLLHGVDVHAANESDTKSGFKVVDEFKSKRNIELFLADRGYKGTFVDRIFLKWNLWVQLAGANDGNNLAPKRWIVERTFAWFNHYRRLSRDYEKVAENSQAMIYVSMIQLMLRKPILARSG